MWWLWWQERNRVSEGDIPTTIIELVHRVKCTSAEYLTCFGNSISNSQTSAEQWRPPPEGVIKFNIDGAFVDGRQQGGWGVVARTSDGEVVAASTGGKKSISPGL
jgi:hypothetical protein